MKTKIFQSTIATFAVMCMAVAPVFSATISGGGNGKETVKKEESANPEPAQVKKQEELGFESYKTGEILRQEEIKPIVAPKPQVITRPSADLAAERPEENASSNSALSFNFVFYVLYKFKFSDI